MARLTPLLSACLLLGSLCLAPTGAQEKKEPDVIQYLQDISVTVRAGPYSGSGVMVQTKDGTVWVWTCAHVIKPLRATRELIDSGGAKKTVVEFEDASIVQFIKEDGRAVSELKHYAEVIRYSDADFGYDLALLRLRTRRFRPASSAKFYLDKDIPRVGTKLYHCGSQFGSFGANTITDGILSQQGRVLDGKIYDQTNCAAFPGSSGGIVCMQSDGRYVGMLVTGIGGSFNLIVPVRQMQAWARKVGVDFTMDDSLAVPDDEKLRSRPVEDSSPDGHGHNHKQRAVLGARFYIWDTRDVRPADRENGKPISIQDWLLPRREAKDGTNTP